VRQQSVSQQDIQSSATRNADALPGVLQAVVARMSPGRRLTGVTPPRTLLIRGARLLDARSS
jgi:hypothetical protein